MQQGVKVSDVARAGQFDRSIDRSQRRFQGGLLGFEFREPTVEQRREERSVLIDGMSRRDLGIALARRRRRVWAFAQDRSM